MLYQNCERWANVIFWGGPGLAAARALFAVFHLFFTRIEQLRYGAPPGTDSLRNLELDARVLELAGSAGIVVGAVFVSEALIMLTDLARNIRRQRMIVENSHGLKTTDPPGTS